MTDTEATFISLKSKNMDPADEKLLDTLLVANWILSGSIVVGIIGCSIYCCLCNTDDEEFNSNHE